MGIIAYVLGTLFVGAVIGLFFGLLVVVPTVIYVAPYAIWVGSQNCIGKHKDKKNEKLTRSARNATKLYAAWISRREPTF